MKKHILFSTTVSKAIWKTRAGCSKNAPVLQPKTHKLGPISKLPSQLLIPYDNSLQIDSCASKKEPPPSQRPLVPAVAIESNKPTLRNPTLGRMPGYSHRNTAKPKKNKAKGKSDKNSVKRGTVYYFFAEQTQRCRTRRYEYEKQKNNRLTLPRFVFPTARARSADEPT